MKYKLTKEDARKGFLAQLRKAIIANHEALPVKHRESYPHHRPDLSSAKISYGRISYNIREKLFLKQKGKCGICFLKMDIKDTHLDHIYPLCMIDKRSIHADRNLQLVHAQCNRLKASQHPITFMQRRGFLL